MGAFAVFKELSKKIGFTETEIKVLLFLAISFLAGFVIKIVNDSSSPEYKNFDYSEQDSLFDFYTKKAEKNLEVEKEKKEKNPVDYKQEVLDFNPQNFENKEIAAPLLEKSVNINAADKESLKRLPGIGEKTAQNIIDYRSKTGGFKTLDELMEVKGIGTAKFNKIKKFLYIESSF